MKKIFLTVFLLSSVLGCAQNTEVDSKFKWTAEMRQQHLNNIEDPATWDQKNLEIDKQIIGYDLPGPFALGVWPVPKYELIAGESEVANGNSNAVFGFGEQTVYMNSFFVYKNPVNESYLEDDDNEVFLHIMVLSDTNAPDEQSVIWSRNYPDFYGQGFVKTGSSHIDYAAFITAERDAFAIINTRIFNLNYGKTILIAPQSDGTLRSMQIDAPKLSKESVKSYSANLLKEEKVVRFFNPKNSN